MFERFRFPSAKHKPPKGGFFCVWQGQKAQRNRAAPAGAAGANSAFLRSKTAAGAAERYLTANARVCVTNSRNAGTLHISYSLNLLSATSIVHFDTTDKNALNAALIYDDVFHTLVFGIAPFGSQQTKVCNNSNLPLCRNVRNYYTCLLYKRYP